MQEKVKEITEKSKKRKVFKDLSMRISMSFSSNLPLNINEIVRGIVEKTKLNF